MSAGQTFPQPEYPPDEPAERSTAEIFLRVCRAVVWVVYAIVIVNVIMLSLAFLLRLFGANPDAGFTEWVYRSVDRTMAPFRGIFPEKPIGDASVFDTSLLFAAIVYLVVALLVDALLRWLGRKVTAEQRSTAAEARRQAALEQAARQQAALEQAAHQQAVAGEPWNPQARPAPGEDPWGRGG